MDKEKLIKLAEDLYQSAFDANAYYAIMMQYSEMSKKYNNEMNLSPAFYQVVYGGSCKRLVLWKLQNCMIKQKTLFQLVCS